MVFAASFPRGRTARGLSKEGVKVGRLTKIFWTGRHRVRSLVGWVIDVASSLMERVGAMGVGQGEGKTRTLESDSDAVMPADYQPAQVIPRANGAYNIYSAHALNPIVPPKILV